MCSRSTLAASRCPSAFQWPSRGANVSFLPRRFNLSSSSRNRAVGSMQSMEFCLQIDTPPLVTSSFPGTIITSSLLPAASASSLNFTRSAFVMLHPARRSRSVALLQSVLGCASPAHINRRVIFSLLGKVSLMFRYRYDESYNHLLTRRGDNTGCWVGGRGGGTGTFVSSSVPPSMRNNGLCPRQYRSAVLNRMSFETKSRTARSELYLLTS